MSTSGLQHVDTPLSSTVLVGRERELELLVERVSTPPAVAMVAGEAGAGKSRLVREMARRSELSGRRILFGHCHPLRDPFPLGPVVEALRGIESERPVRRLSPVAGELRPLLPELAQHLPPRLDRAEDAGVERHRIFRALRELLEALGACVCVFEDLHWADDGTLEFLSFLVSEQPDSLSVVLTYRDELLKPSSPLRSLRSRVAEGSRTAPIELTSLAPTEVRLLAASILATDVREDFAAALHEWSAGFPFAVEEGLMLLRAAGSLEVDDGESPTKALGRLAVPPAVADPILERIALLPRDARLIVRAGAVIDGPADEDLIREVARLSALRSAEALSGAVSAALLTRHGEASYGFRHTLAARTIYQAIPERERRGLHLRVARALEELPQPQLAQLAHHFKRAGRRTKWLRYAEAAADSAMAAGDDRGATVLLEEALATPRLARGPARRMALKLGSAALFGRLPHKAIPILEATLADRSLSAGLRGEVRLSLGRLFSLVAEGESSEREMVRAAGELGRRPTLAARAMAILSGPGAISGEKEKRSAWLQQAIEAAGRQDEPTTKTQVAAARAAFLLTRADPAGWRALDDLPWATTSREERLELVRASKHLAQATVAIGHYRRAERLLDRGEALRSECNHQRFAVGLAGVRVVLDWRTGRWHGLEARAHELTEASAEAPGVSASNELILAWLLLARGEVSDAGRRLTSLLETVQRARLVRPLATVSSALATLRLAGGDAQGARDLSVTGIAGLADEGLWACASTAAPVAVDALIACGETPEATEVVARFARGLRKRDAPAARAALAHCRGSLAQAAGRHDRATRSFAEAERAWRALPCPYEAIRARERRGISLLAGHETRATRCLLGVLNEFHALGAAWDADRVRRALRAQGVSLPPGRRPGRKPYGDELSPREAEVARLAAMRRTNREIADELFISERTVEKHVSSTLRKLGLTSREGIARRGGQKSSVGHE